MSTKTASNTLLDSNIEMIPCSEIDIPPADKSVRTLSRSACYSLAESIKEHGMLQPIGVSENPEGSKKKYTLIFGKHRLYAVSNILKEKKIAARKVIDPEMGIDLTSIAENIFRHAPTKSQLLASRKRWFDAYMKRHPEITPPDAEESVESVHRGDFSISGFTNQLAELTNRTPRQARREARIYKNLNEQQIEDLATAEVTKSDIEAVAAVEDPESTQKIIEAITKQNLDPVDAIDSLAPPDSPARKTIRAASRQRAANKRADEPERQKSTDEEWYSINCGGLANLLANPTQFKSDAILFHNIMEHRANFRSKISKAMSVPRSSGIRGPLFSLINRALSVTPPSEWKICSSCAGRGVLQELDGENHTCLKCRGACYELATENTI